MEKILWEIIQKVRNQSPLVLSITNLVVMNNTANALLAIGASPIMAHAHSEIKDMINICQALVVNIGTLDEYTVESMKLAAQQANHLNKPWVLDPVGAGATPYRDSVLAELLTLKPTVIRGNASEIKALAKENKAATKGVDSTDNSSDAIQAAKQLRTNYNSIIAVSGETDYIVADAIIALNNGNPLMAKVTGLGCTASALIGGFLAVEQDVVSATAAAVSALNIAGELGETKSEGPGSLQVHILDQLYSLDEGVFVEKLKYVQHD